MPEYDLAVRGGTLILPELNKEEKLNIGISQGRIARLSPEEMQAKDSLDASGLYISPGFIDSHMHDEEKEDGESIEKALLRQGVTTAIAGNCGSGPLGADILSFRRNPWLNLGYLTGHKKLREASGVIDRYAPAGPDQVKTMKDLLRKELQEGSFGLSIGLEYLPNTPISELEALFEVAVDFKKIWIPVHIREDGPASIRATQEILNLALKWPLRFQISHLGSMTGFGQIKEVLEIIDKARDSGADVTFDCYPYDAFCTELGSAVFDPGFEKRWGKGKEALEIASGPNRGRWLDEEDLYERLRQEEPECLVIAHVIKQNEVELCLSHPECAIASDGLLKGGRGHPRAAGTFPRALRMLRKAGCSWPEAVRKCTSLPAEMNWLDKGVIKEGADADLVIFDGEKLCDRATFSEELLPPEGIKFVIIGGQAAVKDNEVLGSPKGKLMKRVPSRE
ncbi:MAG: amidohydrolase family protein [Synergistaceae bacterium]|nr:amidohydrolase family protein [Synergistaceae bacterium]